MAQVLIQAGKTGTYPLGSVSQTELGSVVVQTEGLSSGGNTATIKFQGKMPEASTWVDVTFIDQRTQGNPITPGTAQSADSIWSIRGDGMLLQAVVGGTIASSLTLTWSPILGGG